MKYVILIIFLVTKIMSTSAQGYSDDILFWNNDEPLTWADFKSNPDSNITASALSSTGIFYKVFDFDYVAIFCLFRRSTSFTRIKSDNLLEHEQIHFNINELFARKLNAFVINNSDNAFMTIDLCISSLDSIKNECDLYHESFDQESLFSNKIQKQKEWKLKIENEIEDYVEYEINYKSLQEELIENGLPVPKIIFKGPRHFVKNN